MSKISKKSNIRENNETNDSIVGSDKILTEVTKKDIEKSYNVDSINGTEAHYSNRYGWTLRRSTN